MKHIDRIALRQKLTRVAVTGAALATLASGLPASAHMFPSPDGSCDSMSLTTYPRNPYTRVTCYRDADLTQTTGGWIDGTDRIVINGAQGEALHVTYPTPSGPRSAWIPVSSVSHGDLNGSQSLTLRADSTETVYRYPDADNVDVMGRVDPGDEVYLLSGGGSDDHESGRFQVAYPTSSGYKMGYINYRDCADNEWRATGGGQVLEDGTYKVYVSDTHCYDGAGAFNNLHVWEDLPVKQQEIRFHWDGGAYTMQFGHNGKYVDLANGDRQKSANLRGWEGNGTDSQRFWVAYLGKDANGEDLFSIFNCRSGFAADVFQYRTRSNGSNILSYPFGGQTVRLVRTDGGPVLRRALPAQSQLQNALNQGVSNSQLEMAKAATDCIGDEGWNNYCQAFVAHCGRQIGLAHGGAPSAKAACDWWGRNYSTDNIPIGAAVYFQGSNPAGHVGIHVGNNQIVHARSRVKIESLDEMLKHYQFKAWGWQSGVDLRTR